MSRNEEFEGLTLDAALDQASDRMGRRKEDLSYEVVSEDRGFLGVGTTRIAIRVTMPSVPARSTRPARSESRSTRPAPRRERVEAPLPESLDAEDEADEGAGEREDVPTGPDASAPEVLRLVSDLVAKSALDLSARMTEEEDRIVVDLSGADRELLVDRRGELLDALQYLVNRMARKSLGTVKRVQIESDGFRSDREDELRALALDAAERVRRSGEPVWLPPLNPYERRIVHVTLSDQGGVATESQGDGFVKRVVVKPTGYRGAGTPGRERSGGGRRRR